jgi:uncharacterized repeat protein (TIGR03803 family)
MSVQFRVLSRIVLGITVAGCSQIFGSSRLSYIPAANEGLGRTAASAYHVLHSFGYGSDGNNPVASLIDVSGTLYGTTPDGGAYAAAEIWGGTAFSVDEGGKEHLLHSFGQGDDGITPAAGLIDVNGMLFGTTVTGGANRGGTVFTMSATGAQYRVLHSFDGKDGFGPEAALINVRDTLYGTTSGGATYSGGTIFAIDANGGNYRILHEFGKGSDGAYPFAGLVDVKGTLYGTTTCGGRYGAGGCSYFTAHGGTVFSIGTDGTHYRVLHSFGKGSDGDYPNTAFIFLRGELYGTTYYGGPSGDGTLFRISTNGVEHVIYPLAHANGVVGAGGTLYGTSPGNVAFTIRTDGTGYAVLHTFGKGSDGNAPFAGLIYVNGSLYGTTTCGGRYGASVCGDNGLGGTVFELTP